MFTLMAAVSLAAPPVVFQSDAGRYAAAFPGKPRTETKELSTGPGRRAVPVTTDKVDDPSGAVFAVTVADYPESFRDVTPKAVLDGVRDGLKGPDGKLLTDGELTVGEAKHPGRELVIEAGRNLIRARVYLVGTRLYQVTVTGPKGEAGGRRGDEFLKSFELKP